MIFRPKIFISSTFSENKKIRDNIRKFFYSVGAEPLLYEHELTPSINPKVYRTNLLDADFVIMIVKDDYGTTTECGLSGIHEEYRIAVNNNIPLHVYLKANEGPNNNAEANPLIEDLKKDGISFYYFKDDRDLLKRLKETTFTIAKDIMISQLDNNRIPENIVYKLASEKDYNKAMEVINIVEEMQRIHADYDLDYITTDLITSCFGPICFEFKSPRHKFNNWELETQLHKIIEIAEDFMNHSGTDYTLNGQHREFVLNIIGKIYVGNLLYNKCSDWAYDDYCESLKNLFEEYDKFVSIVKNIKVESDIIR
ncbi:MAG: DUF4062 domain-containing protein [Clostridia bacterium]|nr:DUF4062 domain-containing protein [Clostridia bacterium]